MSSKNKKWILAILALALLLIDQAIKFYVKLHFTLGEGVGMFGDSRWAQILFIENNGMAFGMQLGGIAGKIFLSLFRLALIAFLVWYINRLIVRQKANWGVLIAVTLVFVGAVGNIIDSLFYGLIFSESSYTEVASLVPFGEGYAPFLRGKVVDMFYFPIIRYHDFEFFRPVFNFADACISCAVIYVLLFQRKFFMSKKKAK